MDKTLLRPLFKKRYIELHKPQKFFQGGIAMAVEQARLRANDNNKKKQIITKPSGMQEEVTTQEKPIQDVNIVDSLLMGQKNEAELNTQNAQDVNNNLIEQTVDPNKVEYFEDAIKKSQVPQNNLQTKEKSSGLFSDKEKLGIFAALLSQGIGRPGPITENLGPALSSAALGLADIKGTEAEFETQKVKFDKTKEVFDTVTGKNTLATEAEIQTTFNPDGTKRFDIKRDTAKKSFALKKVYDNQLGKNTFVSEEDLYKSVKSGEDRYGIATDGFVSVIFNEDTDYGDKGKKGFVPKFAIQNNPQAFRPLQRDAEQIMAGIIGKDSYTRNSKRIESTTNQLFKAREANAIIKTIKKDLTQKGAEGGTVGQLMQTVAGAEGFLSYFNPFTKEKNFDANKTDLQNAIFNPDKYFNDPNVNTTLQERRRILALSKKIRNNKGLAGLFDSKNQAASAAMRTSVVNLAYALAKAREEGGRFSVTDIELAMKTIGDSSNKTTFLSSLNRTGLELLRPAIDNYLDAQSIANPDVDPKLPKRLQFLMQDLQYYDNPDKEEAIRKLESEKKLQGDDLIIPPLKNINLNPEQNNLNPQEV
jgi:hypothetical protein|tara:strand:- start:3105 stop:4871 length:1767 start_codon:yes stop_codon:yes gene_type:complete